MNATMIRVFKFGLLVAFLCATPALAQQPPSGVKGKPSGGFSVGTAQETVVMDEGKGAGTKEKSARTFYKGNCTWYAATEFTKSTGKTVTWGGNAKDWMKNAATEGLNVSTSVWDIVPGSILVWGATATNSYGHVVICRSVDQIKGEVKIQEMNYKGFGVISSRTLKRDDLRKSTTFRGVILPN